MSAKTIVPTLPDSPTVQTKTFISKLEQIRIKNEKERRECERSFSFFVNCAWEILEADNELVWNWHLTYLCNLMQSEIERIGRHETKIWDRLIINIPPRSLKSMIFTRLACAWAWIKFPWMRFMCGSYSDEFATEHAVECRDVIQSEWYQEHWGVIYQLKSDQNNKSHYRTTYNGARFTFSTGSKATGRGANILLFDDPLSAEQAESETERNKANRMYRRTLASRLNNKRTDVIFIIMQRLHEEDTTGFILENETKRKKILHVCLPAEDCDWVSPAELRKHYTQGLLFPERLPKSFLEAEKEADPYGYSGQYMQRPTPEEGGLFKRRNWRYWQFPGMHLPSVEERIGMETIYCDVVELPLSFDDQVTSWDMTFKDEKTSDYVSGHSIAVKAASYYVMDKEFYRKTHFTESSEGVLKLRNDYPLSTQTLIEDKANGPVIIKMLETVVPDLKPIAADRSGSPYSRAQAVSKIQQSGNVILPHPSIAPWVNRAVNNFAAYPKGAHDDEITSICQGVHYLRFNKPVWAACKTKREKFNLDWRRIPQHVKLYISQWVDTDNSSSILLMAYNQKSGRLAIFDDLQVNSTLPELILHAVGLKIRIMSKMAMTDHSRFFWIGNGSMFGRSATSSGTTRNSSMKNSIAESYINAKVDIYDNSFYNEPGSITLAEKMFYMNAIAFHERAIESNRQCAAWNVEGDKPAPGYGMARALCNVVFHLYYMGEFSDKAKPMKRYSAQHEKYTNDLDWADKAGQLGEFLNTRRLSRGTQTPSKDGWMT